MKKGTKMVIGGVLGTVVGVAAAPLTAGAAVILASVTVGGTAGITLANIFSKADIVVKKGIFILGPQQVGKTTIYDYLNGKNSSSKQTSVSNYDEFTYNIDADKSLIIRKGKDIGGGQEYIRFYEKMIKDKDGDYGFFVFNAYNYMFDIEDHRRDVNARLDFIFRKKILSKKTIIIGSFIDQFDEKERGSVAKKIKKMTEDKPYSVLLSGEYFHLLNLKDNEELNVFFKKIFKN